MKRTAAALTASISLVVLAGCGSDEEPDPSPSPSAAASEAPAASSTPEQQGKRVPITIANGEVEPQGARVEVAVGEPIELVVTSDAADELHVHSDPEHTFDVEAGAREESFTFTVETPGQVALESHHLGVTIVQLVVRP